MGLKELQAQTSHIAVSRRPSVKSIGASDFQSQQTLFHSFSAVGSITKTFIFVVP